ncbi:thiamine phosphate phosphatase-like protein [Dioscorea cayenensis subsp. rotundata]|uniref:Thiamine phosphate phosphatase-like protein n=1 Tax=Dioscorea cayennensis subsp. rotundata TaxID=55577 RepID=A0AB40B3E3_DIOCR|nr:thiamine phosphate phosphatase-like protein [Dioscorea cayenensis subsp. rotundata]
MAETVVVFDFDKTLINCDSDDWVIREFGLAELFKQLMFTMPWNSLIDRMMNELHSQGKTVEAIADCLKRAPLDPHVVNAIKFAFDLGCDMRVISDANIFFIETILKHHGIIGCFSEINSNPFLVDENGRLRILPYHDFTTSPHGCSLCPPNMCKGKVIERIRASVSGKRKQFIYIGDGMGDYCPSLKLTEGDHVMPRKNYPLWKRINDNAQLIKAAIHEWSNGEELEKTLLHLVHGSMPAK